MATKIHVEFDWDDAKELSNMRKHGIKFGRAVEIFNDPDANTEHDILHSDEEDRWVTAGFDKSGTLLMVCHTYVEITPVDFYVRIISAREPTKRETDDHWKVRLQ